MNPKSSSSCDRWGAEHPRHSRCAPALCSEKLRARQGRSPQHHNRGCCDRTVGFFFSFSFFFSLPSLAPAFYSPELGDRGDASARRVLFPMATTRSITRVASPARGVSISHGTWMAFSFPKKPTQRFGNLTPPETELEGGGTTPPSLSAPSPFTAWVAGASASLR